MMRDSPPRITEEVNMKAKKNAVTVASREENVARMRAALVKGGCADMYADDAALTARAEQMADALVRKGLVIIAGAA
jgi:hypothetical protein